MKTLFRLPGYHYCGYGTGPGRGSPVNRLDRVCMRHDVAYRMATEALEIRRADERLRDDADALPGFAARLVGWTMRAKMAAENAGLLSRHTFWK